MLLCGIFTPDKFYIFNLILKWQVKYIHSTLGGVYFALLNKARVRVFEEAKNIVLLFAGHKYFFPINIKRE